MLFFSSRSRSRIEKDDVEEALIREIEESLKDGINPGPADAASDQSENLPSNPFRFVLHYLRYYRWPLLAMVLLELGQAACQILIPKAVQLLIDSAALLRGRPDVSIWTELSGPMKFFVILNIGILIFSRSSGALLVMVGPALQAAGAKQSLPISAGPFAAILHGELCGVALQPRLGSVDGSKPLAVDDSFRLLAGHGHPGGFPGPARAGSFRSRSGAGFVDAGIRRRLLCARDALPGIREGVCSLAKRSERSDRGRCHECDELEALRAHGFRAPAPAALSGSRSSGCASHILVHGTHALVSVHRHPVAYRSA